MCPRRDTLLSNQAHIAPSCRFLLSVFGLPAIFGCSDGGHEHFGKWLDLDHWFTGGKSAIAPTPIFNLPWEGSCRIGLRLWCLYSLHLDGLHGGNDNSSLDAYWSSRHVFIFLALVATRVYTSVFL